MNQYQYNQMRWQVVQVCIRTIQGISFSIVNPAVHRQLRDCCSKLNELALAILQLEPKTEQKQYLEQDID